MKYYYDHMPITLYYETFEEAVTVYQQIQGYTELRYVCLRDAESSVVVLYHTPKKKV